MKLIRIVSSGTPGAEHAALRAAKNAGIISNGWKEKNSDKGDFGLKETPSTRKEQSTIWNIRDSHATLIIDPIGEYLHTNLALEVAEVYGRPVLVSSDPNEIVSWLNKLGDELTLNVMGMSEDLFEGIENASFRLMKKVLNHLNADSITRKG